MLDEFKKWKKGVLAIFIILILANVAFFAILISYLDIDITTIEILEDVGLILSSVIIFAFISSKLPMLRKLGDSSLYDVTYFMIMAVFTLFISYYNSYLNSVLNLEHFLDLFNILTISLIFMVIVMHLNIFKEIIAGNKSKRNLFICMVLFSILGIISTQNIFLADELANIRNAIIIIGSMFGGPIVGIPSAIIAGLFRYSLGGVTALPCSIATILSGFIGSAIYILNGNKFLTSAKSVVLMFLVVGVEMLFIILFIPNEVAIPIIKAIYAPMLFSSIIAVVLFKLVIKENEENVKGSKDPQTEIKELKEKLNEQEERIAILESQNK